MPSPYLTVTVGGMDKQQTLEIVRRIEVRERRQAAERRQIALQVETDRRHADRRALDLAVNFPATVAS